MLLVVSPLCDVISPMSPPATMYNAAPFVVLIDEGLSPVVRGTKLPTESETSTLDIQQSSAHATTMLRFPRLATGGSGPEDKKSQKKPWPGDPEDFFRKSQVAHKGLDDGSGHL